MSYVVFFLLVMLIGFAIAYDFHAERPIRYNVRQEFANDFKNTMHSQRSHPFYSSAANSDYFDAPFSNFFSASAHQPSYQSAYQPAYQSSYQSAYKSANQFLAHSTSWSIYSFRKDYSARSYSHQTSQPPSSVNVPKLDNATYSSNGAVIKLSFKPNIQITPNIIDAENGSYFPCSSMFEFTCKNEDVADNLQCRFTVEGVDLYIESESYYENVKKNGKNPLAECLEIGSEITVKAETYTVQSSVSYNEKKTVKISPSSSSNITTPSVFISAPLVVGGCDDVTLASFIKDSSGRYLRHIKWVVSAFDQDETYLNISTDNIIDSLTNQRLEDDTIKLKRDLFVDRAKYIIFLSACNFFSGQASESKDFCFKDVKVSFDVKSESIPLVKIVRNEPIIKITKSQTIHLNSVVTNNCKENIPYVYEWSIEGVNPISTSKKITSLSKDRSILKLDIPESYSFGNSFFIILDVNGGRDKVQIEIVHGYIHTIVSNSTYLSAYVGSTISIVTSESYDEDKSKFIVKPKFSEGDEDYIEDMTNYSLCSISGCGVTSLRLNKVPTEGILNFIMYAEPGNGDPRIDYFKDDKEWLTKISVQMFLEILETSVPLVSVQWSAATSKFNTNNRLILVGGIQTTVDSLPLKTFSWSIVSEDESIEIDPPGLLTVSKGPILNPGFFNLVISSNALVDYQGSELFFKFTCAYGAYSSDATISSKIKIVINDIPAQGFLSYTPPSGEALVTMFTLSAKDWSDDDMPLSYQFNYFLEDSDKLVLLRSSSIVSAYSTKLPVGRQIPHVTVFDSLNAFNAFSSDIAVEVTKSSNTDAFDSIFDSLEDLSQLSTDQALGTLSLLGSSLNAVECNFDCRNLYNRLTCDLPNTCGPCKDESFIGVAGSSNSKCLDPDEFSASQDHDGNTCTANENCGGGVFECINALCQVGDKECIGDCNDNGVCKFLDAKDGSTVLDTCALTDSSCFAKCFCEDTYAGAGCDITKDEMHKRQEYRAQMLKSLSSVLDNAEITSESLDSFISLSNSLTSNPDELSDESIETSLDISDTAIDSMNTDVVPISNNLLTGVFSSLSNLGSAMRNMANGDATGRRRLEAKIRMNPITKSMGTVAYLTSKTMVLGQEKTTYITDTTRIDVRLESGYNDNELVDIEVPSTSFEDRFGMRQPRVKFAKTCVSSGSTLTIITQSTDHLLFKNDLESSKNDVISSNVIVKIEDDCSNSALDSFKVDIPSLVEITTDIDDQLICESLFSDSACTMLSHTSTEITCTCDPVTSGRRMLSSPSGKQYYMFDASAALKPPSKPSSDEKGWVYDNIVTGALTIVIVFGVVGMWYAYKSNTDRNFKYNVTKFYNYITSTCSDDDAFSKVSVEGVDGVDETESKHVQVQKVGFVDFQNALPASLRSGVSYFSKVGVEIKRRHRWFRIANNDSSHISPYMKIFSLLTSIFLVMFFEALIFHFFYTKNDEDPKCAASNDRESCEDVKSIYYHNVANCRWSETRGYCTTVSPNDRVEIAVLVAIFAVFIAYPLIELCDHLIFNVLCRSTKDGQFASTNFVDYISNACNNGQKDVAFDDNFVLSDSVLEFLARLKQYRDSLSSEDRDQFEQTWRINDKYFLRFSESPDKYISESATLKNLRDRFMSLRAKEQAEFDSILAEGIIDDNAAVGKRLLFLFQLDLLDLNPEGSQIVATNVVKNIKFRDAQSNIFYTRPTVVKAEDGNDSEHFGKGVESSWFSSVNRPNWINEKHVPKADIDSCVGKGEAGDRPTNGKSIRQVHAWLFLLTLDFWILFYLYWFAARGLDTSQSAWLKSFIAWSVTDIIFLSPLVIVVVNILLPTLLIGSQLESLRSRIRDTLTAYKPDMQEEVFNSARYLLLSHRLSLRFPHLEESKIILSFSTPKPLNVFDDAAAAADVSSLSYFECVLLCLRKWLNKFVKLPIFLTDFIVVEVVNIFVAYLLLGIVALCRVIANNVSPFLIFILSIPFLLICTCVYYLLKDYGLHDDTPAVVDNKSVNISIDDTRVSIDDWFKDNHEGDDVNNSPSHSNAAAANKNGNTASRSLIPTFMNDSDSDHERSERPGRNQLNLRSSSGVLIDDDSNSSNSSNPSNSDSDSALNSLDSTDDSDDSDVDDVDEGDIEVRVRDVEVKVQIKSPVRPNRRSMATGASTKATVASDPDEVVVAVDSTVGDAVDGIVSQALGGNDQSDADGTTTVQVTKEKKIKKGRKEKKGEGESGITDIIEDLVYGDGEKKAKKEKKKSKKVKSYDDNNEAVGRVQDPVEDTNTDFTDHAGEEVIDKSLFAATKIQALFRAKSIRNSIFGKIGISTNTTTSNTTSAAVVDDDVSPPDQASFEVDIAQQNEYDNVNNTVITEMIDNNSNTNDNDVVGNETSSDVIGSAKSTPNTKKDKKKKEKKERDNVGSFISDVIEDLGFDGSKKEKKEEKRKTDKKFKESKDNDSEVAKSAEASVTTETSTVESGKSYDAVAAESVDASTSSNVSNIDDSNQDDGDIKSPKKKGGKKKGKEKDMKK